MAKCDVPLDQAMNEAKKNRSNPPPPAIVSNPISYGGKTLGLRPRGPRGAFIPPFRNSKLNGGTTPRVEDKSESGAADESTRRWSEIYPLSYIDTIDLDLCEYFRSACLPICEDFRILLQTRVSLTAAVWICLLALMESYRTGFAILSPNS